MGQQWQRYLTDGHNGWQGDPDLVLAHNRQTGKIEVFHDDGQQYRLVMRDDEATFDIDLLCRKLDEADPRKHSIHDHLAAIDAGNEQLEVDKQRRADDEFEEVSGKMYWAMRVDTGHHVRPILVPRGINS